MLRQIQAGPPAPARFFTSQLPKRAAQTKHQQVNALHRRSVNAATEDTIIVNFLGSKKQVTARPGDNIYEVSIFPYISYYAELFNSLYILYIYSEKSPSLAILIRFFHNFAVS